MGLPQLRDAATQLRELGALQTLRRCTSERPRSGGVITAPCDEPAMGVSMSPDLRKAPGDCGMDRGTWSLLQLLGLGHLVSDSLLWLSCRCR